MNLHSHHFSIRFKLIATGESVVHEMCIRDREEVEQLMQEANARIENTIRSIQEAQAEKEKTRQARQELTNFSESMEALANKELEEKIARKIGLPEDVIADASEIVGSEYINADKSLQDIVRDKRYWEGDVYKRQG